MSKNKVFDQALMDVIRENLEIFKYEYPKVKDKDWEEFQKNTGCGSCINNIITHLKKDKGKMNAIFSKLLDEDVVINFMEALESPIVKEFDNIVEMETFLKRLKEEGKIIRTVSPSPNGKGGYILVLT